MLRRIIFFHFFIFHFFCLAAHASLTNDKVREDLIEAVEAIKKRQALVSISFAFFHGDDVVFNYASGYADRGKKIKATSDHIYTLASVTKSITGMTLVDLAHQNYLTLQDSVHNFIEGMPKNIRLLDLLNHTSGFLREKENEHFLVDSKLSDIVKHLPVKFNLKIHRYANYNYSVIGAVIEKVTGRPFHAVASDYYHSITGENLYFLNHDHQGSGADFAAHYVRKGRRYIAHKPVEFGLWEPAAFGQTTARGLAKFLRYHMTPQFISLIESYAVTTKEYKKNRRKIRESYALGFRLRYVDDELNYVFHNGFIYGVISTIFYFPGKDAGFVAISNMSSYPGQTLGLGHLYTAIESRLDRHFNNNLAEYTANYGLEAGLQYYSRVKKTGQVREKSLSVWAVTYMKKNKNEEAISVLLLIKNLFPQTDLTYRRLAETYLKTGQEELAEEALIQGIMADPKPKKSAKMLRKLDSKGAD